MSARELREWQLLYGIKAEEAELRQQGFSEDEISDHIAAGPATHGGPAREGLEDDQDEDEDEVSE